MSCILRGGIYGAGGQTRTGTRFPSPDFKSGMSTNSITPACATVGPQVWGVYSLQIDLKVTQGNALRIGAFKRRAIKSFGIGLTNTRKQMWPSRL